MVIKKGSDLYNSIESVADDLGYTLYPDYSGRCMYGKTCLGITGSIIHLSYFIIGLCQDVIGYTEDNEAFATLLEAFDNTCTDSLGINPIIYFPHLQVEEDENE